MVFKTMKFGEPTYLRANLASFGLETNVTVRHANDAHRLFEPRTNRNIGERAFKYHAPRLYNRLPLEMRQMQEVRKFKKSLKTFIFNKCYDMQTKTVKEEYHL